MNVETFWQARAVALELLSLSFRYPTPELADSIISGEWRAACIELEQAGCFLLPEGFADVELALDADGVAVKDRDAFVRILRVEATRLFIGAPEPAVSPFEGVWRAVDDGVQPLLFANPHSIDVMQFLKSCGMGQPEGANEPLDHVATELEFMQYLAMLEAGIASPAESSVGVEDFPGGTAAAAYEHFLESHPKIWLGRFAASVEEQARLSFYRIAAQVLSAFIA